MSNDAAGIPIQATTTRTTTTTFFTFTLVIATTRNATNMETKSIPMIVHLDTISPNPSRTYEDTSRGVREIAKRIHPTVRSIDERRPRFRPPEAATTNATRESGARRKTYALRRSLKTNPGWKGCWTLGASCARPISGANECKSPKARNIQYPITTTAIKSPKFASVC